MDRSSTVSPAEQKKVRALGWVLVVLGPCISAAMAAAAFYLFDTIYHYGRPVSPTHWHGGPDFTRLTFELFGSLFLLGIAVFAGGVYQVRTGRRHPVLVGIVLLLAAVMVYFVCGILSARSPSV